MYGVFGSAIFGLLWYERPTTPQLVPTQYVRLMDYLEIQGARLERLHALSSYGAHHYYNSDVNTKLVTSFDGTNAISDDMQVLENIFGTSGPAFQSVYTRNTWLDYVSGTYRITPNMGHGVIGIQQRSYTNTVGGQLTTNTYTQYSFSPFADQYVSGTPFFLWNTKKGSTLYTDYEDQLLFDGDIQTRRSVDTGTTNQPISYNFIDFYYDRVENPRLIDAVYIDRDLDPDTTNYFPYFSTSRLYQFYEIGYDEVQVGAPAFTNWSDSPFSKEKPVITNVVTWENSFWTNMCVTNISIATNSTVIYIPHPETPNVTNWFVTNDVYEVTNFVEGAFVTNTYGLTNVYLRDVNHSVYELAYGTNTYLQTNLNYHSEFIWDDTMRLFTQKVDSVCVPFLQTVYLGQREEMVGGVLVTNDYYSTPTSIYTTVYADHYSDTYVRTTNGVVQYEEYNATNTSYIFEATNYVYTGQRDFPSCIFSGQAGEYTGTSEFRQYDTNFNIIGRTIANWTEKQADKTLTNQRWLPFYLWDVISQDHIKMQAIKRVRFYAAISTCPYDWVNLYRQSLESTTTTNNDGNVTFRRETTRDPMTLATLRGEHNAMVKDEYQMSTPNYKFDGSFQLISNDCFNPIAVSSTAFTANKDNGTLYMTNYAAEFSFKLIKEWGEDDFKFPEPLAWYGTTTNTYTNVVDLITNLVPILPPIPVVVPVIPPITNIFGDRTNIVNVSTNWIRYTTNVVAATSNVVSVVTTNHIAYLACPGIDLYDVTQSSWMSETNNPTDDDFNGRFSNTHTCYKETTTEEYTTYPAPPKEPYVNQQETTLYYEEAKIAYIAGLFLIIDYDWHYLDRYDLLNTAIKDGHEANGVWISNEDQ
jgi:hypothetical protein